MIKYIIVLCVTLVLDLISPAKALVLEDLLAQGRLEVTLTNKKVGYYVGSFDPLHLGHEDLVNLSLHSRLCDYVLIYPAWGGDNYKNRVDIARRHDMVFSVFADHPRVIVTRLSPQDMQSQLTKSNGYKSPEGKPLVDVVIPGLEFIGIVGSDTALAISTPEAARPFLTGLQIPEKYHNSTLGGLMALPAKTFIVAMRADDNIDHLNNYIIDRPIIAVIKSEKEQNLSSTGVKRALKSGESIGTMVSPSVINIIQEYSLY